MDQQAKVDLYGFELHYANGCVDYGMIIATSAETARLHIESQSLIGLKGIVVQGQGWALNVLTDKFGGMAVFAPDLMYN